MKRSFHFIIVITCISLLAVQCTSNQQPANNDGSAATDSNATKAKSDTVVVLAGINSKGVGRFKNIQLTHPLDEKMASNGQDIYQTKCFACHKLTNELLDH